MAETTHSTTYYFCSADKCNWYRRVVGVSAAKTCPKCLKEDTIKYAVFHGQQENSVIANELNKGATFMQALEMVRTLSTHWN